jgi:hypothetical protein
MAWSDSEGDSEDDSPERSRLRTSYKLTVTGADSKTQVSCIYLESFSTLLSVLKYINKFSPYHNNCHRVSRDMSPHGARYLLRSRVCSISLPRVEMVAKYVVVKVWDSLAATVWASYE